MGLRNVLWLPLMGSLEVALAFSPTYKANGITTLSSLQATSPRSFVGRERKRSKTYVRSCSFHARQYSPVRITRDVGYLRALPTDSSQGENKLYLEELSKLPQHSATEAPPSAIQQQLTNLQEQMEQLRQKNERLQNQLAIQQKFIQDHPTLSVGEGRPMLILESFEGDGSWFTRGNIFKKDEEDEENGVEETTQQPISTIIVPSDAVLWNQTTTNVVTVDDTEAVTVGPLSPLEGSTPASTLSSVTGAQHELKELWCNDVEEADDGGTCPIEPNISFRDALRDRAYWLVGLLAMQSCSGFILARNELLLQNHPVIIYFLTMLVGAGGNAGNQASVRGE
jgi:TolA-binding protein